MKVSQHPEALIELPEEELEILRKQAEKFEFDQLSHLFNLLLKADEEIAQSTFPRTMLEMTLIRMATLRPIVPLDDILKKLEGLERRHPSSGSKEQEEPPPSRKTREPQKGTEDRGEPQKIREAGVKEELPEPRGSSKGSTEEMKILSVERRINPEEPKTEEASQKIREETWRGLIDYTRAKNPILGSFLALGNLTHMSEEKIEIGFEKDSFHYERILEKENRSQLESICREYLQRKARVVIHPMDQKIVAKGRGVFGAEGSLPNELEQPMALKGEGEDSLVEEALRLFDGRIVERREEEKRRDE
jgi:DNA polymerase-3 subunit gamma/tau